MSRPFEVVQRQIQEGSARLPQVQVPQSEGRFEALSSALGQFGQFAAQQAQRVAIERSGQRGQQEALEREGEQRTLMPGINDATRAYNQAFLDTDARLTAQAGHKLHAEAFAKLSSNINSESAGQLRAKMDAINEGILKNAVPENRAQVALALQQSRDAHDVKMISAVSKYNMQQIDRTYGMEEQRLQKEIVESYESGDKEGARYHELELKKVRAQYGILSQSVADRVPEIRERANSLFKVAEHLGEFKQELELSPQDAAKALQRMVERKPEDLTNEEHQSLIKKAFTLNNQRLQIESLVDNETLQRGLNDVAANSFDTLEGLEAEYASELSAIDFTRLKDAWVKAQGPKLSLSRVMEAYAKEGSAGVSLLPNTVQNEAYDQGVQEVLNWENQLAREDNPDAPEKTDLTLAERMQKVVAPWGVPIQKFNAQMHGAVQSNIPERIQDAVNAYRFARENAATYGDVVKGMDADTKEALEYAAIIGVESEADDVELVRQALKNIRDKSDPTMQERRSRLDSYIRSNAGLNAVDRSFESFFGVKPGTEETDDAYGVFKSLFRKSFMGVADGNAEAALNLARVEARDWGTSRFGEENVVYNRPPEKAVQLADEGNWLENQIMITWFNILKDNEARKTGIKMPKHYKLEGFIPPAGTNEEDIFTKSIANGDFIKRTTPEEAGFFGPDEKNIPTFIRGLPKGFTFIKKDDRGIEREYTATLDPTYATRTGAAGLASYAFVYRDEYGALQHLTDSRQQTPDNVAIVNVQQLGQFLPEFYQTMDDKRYSEIADRKLRAEFEQAQREGIVTFNKRAMAKAAMFETFSNTLPGFRSVGDAIKEVEFKKFAGERLKTEPEKIKKMARGDKETAKPFSALVANIEDEGDQK